MNKGILVCPDCGRMLIPARTGRYYVCPGCGFIESGESSTNSVPVSLMLKPFHISTKDWQRFKELEHKKITSQPMHSDEYTEYMRLREMYEKQINN